MEKLIVRPTLPGFGTVVGKLSDWPTTADWRGCVIVNLTPDYAKNYQHEVGGEVAYSKFITPNDGSIYITVEP